MGSQTYLIKFCVQAPWIHGHVIEELPRKKGIVVHVGEWCLWQKLGERMKWHGRPCIVF
jgi:hypothetical protein